MLIFICLYYNRTGAQCKSVKDYQETTGGKLHETSIQLIDVQLIPEKAKKEAFDHPAVLPTHPALAN